MSNPQQPELGRSRRGEVDQQGRRQAREADTGSSEGKEAAGKVPEENQPLRKPSRQQDKPSTVP